MTAPFRDPRPARVDEVWPPPFELGPELTATYLREARQLRLEAIRRLLFRLVRLGTNTG